MMRKLIGLMLAAATLLPTTATAQRDWDGQTAAGAEQAWALRQSRDGWHGRRGGNLGPARLQDEDPRGGDMAVRGSRGSDSDDRRFERRDRTPDRRGLQFDNRREERRGNRGWSERQPDWARSSFTDRRDDAWARSRFDDRRAWNRGWRNDDRFDWGGYRSANRDIYRLPRYYSPSQFGGYRRFGVGRTLQPLFWGRNYWISDPWSYRLPDAWGSYQWVRYYGDALLVDLRSGTVVDAVYGIFG